MSVQHVHLSLMVDGRQIEAAVPLPAGPSVRRVLLPVLQGLTDTVVAIAAEGKAVSCRKGCDACCRQMVPISPTEAFGIAAVIDGFSPERRAAMVRTFDAAVETLGEKGVLGRLRDRHKLSDEEQLQLDRDYFLAGVACPFLEAGACSIHPERPLACREFLVESDPVHCRNPHGDKVLQVPMPAKVSMALAGRDEGGWVPLVLAREFVAGGGREAVGVPAEMLGEILRDL